MPRLLIPILSATRGGAEEYAAAIAAHARANDFDVHTLVSTRPAMAEFAAELDRAGATVHRLPVEEAGVKPTHPFRHVRVRRAIQSTRPDLVLLPIPGIRYGLDIMRLCVHLGIPCCPVYQLIRWEQWNDRLADKLATLLANPLIKTIVVSEFDRNALLQRANLPADRISVIHNGIDLDRFAPSPSDREQTRRSFGFSDDTTVCMSVGRLDEQKGCDLLTAAIPKLLRSHPNTHFVWAGEGPLRAKLLHDADVMGVAGRVHLTGRRTDIPQLLAAADLFVFPSRFEGFPFALLEAMAAAVPVVASDIPAVREAVGSGDAALLVPPDDVYHLRRGVAQALANSEGTRRRAQAASVRVQQFSKAEMARKTLDLLRASVQRPAHA